MKDVLLVLNLAAVGAVCQYWAQAVIIICHDWQFALLAGPLEIFL